MNNDHLNDQMSSHVIGHPSPAESLLNQAFRENGELVRSLEPAPPTCVVCRARGSRTVETNRRSQSKSDSAGDDVFNYGSEGMGKGERGKLRDEKILKLIVESGAVTVSQISKFYFNCDPSNSRRTIHRLESQGLIYNQTLNLKRTNLTLVRPTRSGVMTVTPKTRKLAA